MASGGPYASTKEDKNLVVVVVVVVLVLLATVSVSLLNVSYCCSSRLLPRSQIEVGMRALSRLCTWTCLLVHLNMQLVALSGCGRIFLRLDAFFSFLLDTRMG